MCLRQAYERREITEVKQVEGDTNLADSMTKSKPLNALKLLIDTNKVQLKERDQVERVEDENRVDRRVEDEGVMDEVKEGGSTMPKQAIRVRFAKAVFTAYLNDLRDLRDSRDLSHSLKRLQCRYNFGGIMVVCAYVIRYP